jgi:hypothetical protein
VVLDEAVLQLTGLIDGLGIRVLSGLLTPQRMRATVLSWIDGQLLLSPNSPDTPDTTNTMNTPDPSERTAS